MRSRTTPPPVGLADLTAVAQALGGNVHEVRDTLRNRAVEIVCGLVMVVVGVWITATSSAAKPPEATSPGWVAAGGLLTALGGVLLSWVAAVAFSRREAVMQLNEEFHAVSRNLGQAATRVTRAVEQCQAQEIDSTTSLALISQATTMIYGQIDQIQRLIGARFDSDDLMLTLTELDKLAAKLDRQPSESSADVRNEVARILARARKVVASPRTTSSVEDRSRMPLLFSEFLSRARSRRRSHRTCDLPIV